MGAIGIDGQLVEAQTEDIVEMSNGCICCTVRKDLVKGIQKLLKRESLDYILIETTGVADPGPVRLMGKPAVHQLGPNRPAVERARQLLPAAA